MAAAQDTGIAPHWLRPVAILAVAALHGAVLFGLAWPDAREAAVTAPLAVTVVPQGNPLPSMETPDPAEAVEVRPPSAASIDSVASESEVVEVSEPTEQARERPVEVAEAIPVEIAAARAPDRVAHAVAPPSSAERIDRHEQAEMRPEPVDRATPQLDAAREVTATAVPSRAPTQQAAPSEPQAAAAQPAQPSEARPLSSAQAARPAPAPSMQFNPASVAESGTMPESRETAAEAQAAPPSERAASAPAAPATQGESAADKSAAQPAEPPAAEAAPVRPRLQPAPAVERTGPVQQAMRTAPNEATVRDRPDRGDPMTANDRKPEKQKQEQKKKKPKPRSTASTAASASAPSRRSQAASVSGSIGSANYRSLVMAELNRRKFYPSGARDARGVVVVTFSIGGSGSVTSSRITRSSGNSALDGAVLQMMRQVSLPPPPGGSFRATVPVHFDLRR